MRYDYIRCDEYFMGLAMFSAQRSKDPSTQVGACIVSKDNKIISVGYNGMPTGCIDELMPWSREGESSLDTKYPFVCHAELNAILNSNMGNLSGSTLYVTLYPCNECAKAIIQSGIKRIVYRENKYANTEAVKASAILFTKCGIRVDEYEPSGKQVTLDL